MAKRALVAAISFCIMVLAVVLLPVSSSDAAHVSHAPIVIVGDSQFTLANGVVGGSGTLASPYNISGWDIDAMSATDGVGIRISNTTAHFVISDVTIGPGNIGVWMGTLSNGSVQLSTFSYNAGIYMLSCVDMNASDNYMNEGSVYASSSSRLNISGNDMHGIQFVGCSETSSRNNKVSGIWLQDSLSCTLQGNNITTYGVQITGSSLEAFGSHQITPDNTVSGNPIRYFKDLTDPEFSSPMTVGQLIVVNCTGASVHSLSIPTTYFPITIAYDSQTTVSNNTLDILDTGSSQGVTIIHCNYTAIENNSISGAQLGGIWLESSTNTVVSHNNLVTTSMFSFIVRDSSELLVSHNSLSGLSLERTVNVTVEGNDISAFYLAVYVNSCAALDISNNSIHADGWQGVEVYASSDVRLFGNSITGSYPGLLGYGLYQGVDINLCSRVRLTGNALLPASPNHASFESGVRIATSDDVFVEENNLSWSNFAGLEVTQCSSVNLTGNEIFSSGPAGTPSDGIALTQVTAARILSNDISGALYGISVQNGSDIWIAGNELTSNLFAGLRMVSSDNSIISNNNLSANAGGLDLENSQDCSVIRNLFEANSLGAWLSQCTNITIHHNEFLDNQIHAQDDAGVSNHWDDGYPSGGNYWSGFIGVDLYSGPAQDLPGSDGINDTPYVFTGGQDRYPLMSPPELRHPPVARFEITPSSGESTVIFTFNASTTTDPVDPTGTLMFRWDFDGDGTWDTGWSHNLTATHQYISPGEYNVRLEVRDQSGYINETQVNVIVGGSSIPEFDSVTLIVLAMLCGFVCLIRVVSRRRKGSS